MNYEKEIIELYIQQSKHSNYQVLSKRLTKIVGTEDLNIISRYENERLSYITKIINIKGKSILDIGGNTGFFTFEMLERGAASVHYYEGNKIHASFVRLASKILNVENKLIIKDKYFSFTNELGKRYELILLLNVLHHFGDDYGDHSISIESAKIQVIKQLNSLAYIGTYLAFQMGFNWKGNKDFGFFANGTKEEMIHFIEEGVKENWKILKIGIASKNNDRIKYFDINNLNVARFDELGEFLNRPIFILKSLQ